ncbi:hypothetical protein FPV67DRAFT_1780866 [Lyophyllum atratum]|nr:hypothetical protein FPV67DRAFT_1780866 [Lyophyllum atratum]
MVDETSSVFSYDGEGEPDSFSLSQLKVAVERHFEEPCQLEKLSEGGYHKVYNILHSDGTPLDAVVRVACPAFPIDKLESEVATYKYLAAHTKIPVPDIYAWNSDASNPVGAEYLIMQKVPGASASDSWESLPDEVRTTVVSEVAQHVMEIFSLRFDSAGSLYWAPQSNDFRVGPIISTPFYRALDGVVRIPGHIQARVIDPNRGPFSNVSGYLSSFLNAELDFLSEHRLFALSELGDGSSAMGEHRLEQGERVIKKAIELCSIYPGDIPILDNVRTPEKLFSLRLDDFRLSNIMIDVNTGRVTGLLDFEGATTAPLWECAIIPRWLQHPDDPESSYGGGPEKLRSPLRTTFLDTVDRSELGGEWRNAYTAGRPFRRLTDRLNFQVNVWASDVLEEWVDEHLEWAKVHPGIGLPERDM